MSNLKVMNHPYHKYNLTPQPKGLFSKIEAEIEKDAGEDQNDLGYVTFFPRNTDSREYDAFED